MDALTSKPKKILVVGGSGFVGRHLSEKLSEMGHNVNVFDVREPFSHKSINFYTGDLCMREALETAITTDVEVVVHCATPTPVSRNKSLFYKVNVEGTRTLLDVCKEKEVKTFILLSTASVVFSGYSIKGGTEDIPYASKPLDYYIKTKIIQEKMVLEADSPGFNTVAVRPHGIFGPRDRHLVPTAARLASAGKAKFIVGGGSNKVDFTYIDNVIYAILLIIEKMNNTSEMKGNAYNITNDQPIMFWQFMSRLLVGLHYKPPRYHVPYYLIYFLALIVQFVCFILSPIITLRPSLTPMTVALAGTHHYFSCEKAKKDFQYKVTVNLDEGLHKTLTSFSKLKNKKDSKIPNKKVLT